MARLPKAGIDATHEEIFKMSRDQAEEFTARAEAFHSALKVRELMSRESYQSASAYHNRTVTIQEVSEYSASQINDTLWRYHREFPGQPVTVLLNSPGGSVFAGLAIFDTLLALRHAGTEVTTIAYGMAASMGSILLQAGDVRMMAPNSYLMIHEVSSGVRGTVSDVEDTTKFMKKLQNKALDILSERSTLTRETIRRRSSRMDWWMDAEEALEAGFIDTIATPAIAAAAES